LAAFSGKLAGKNNLTKFVPPIVDLLDENGFYRRGEDELNTMNRRIEALEASEELKQRKSAFAATNQQAQMELARYKQAMKMAKKERDTKRISGQTALSAIEFEQLKEQLKNESLKWQYDLKMLIKQWDFAIAASQERLAELVVDIAQLKESRKSKSAALQQRLFESYSFINYLGVHANAIDIFAQTEAKVPPAGAGDCAAPKLLQYAYLHQLEPIAMAEFWWGQSPKSEIRKHGQFYPSCRSKCEPILGHMLKGLNVDPNPVLASATVAPTIIYEDDHLGILVKPHEYLSVPGKTTAPSIATFLHERYPNATGPLIVHRLDMSTSGLMVFAKTMECYQHLQHQFLQHAVKKRYVALLDGIVAADKGTIELPLRVDLDDRPRQLVCYEYGKHAITHYEVTERQNGQTRINFYPQTGRTHQLRVHAAHALGLNCPIIGDELYGTKANRLHLHAEFLEFVHPTTQQRLKFQAKADF
jgi:tRNA pseudouridine32 synthase / 23S rRNA pseudouridine746 synthase